MGGGTAPPATHAIVDPFPKSRRRAGNLKSSSVWLPVPSRGNFGSWYRHRAVSGQWFRTHPRRHNKLQFDLSDFLNTARDIIHRSCRQKRDQQPRTRLPVNLLRGRMWALVAPSPDLAAQPAALSYRRYVASVSAQVASCSLTV